MLVFVCWTPLGMKSLSACRMSEVMVRLAVWMDSGIWRWDLCSEMCCSMYCVNCVQSVL